MTTVTWTKNGSGQYEVASAQHLVQLMNQGSLYTDAGDAPTDYWGSSYLQTSDIDLANDHPGIKPIGDITTNFTGTYDGGFYNISNWSYASETRYIGLFGTVRGATLKRIRLAGVWTIQQCGYSTGFLVGHCVSTTIHDVEGDFSGDTSIGDRTDLNTLGVLVGRMNGVSSIYGATVRGIIDIETSASGYAAGYKGFFIGGVVGLCSAGVSLTMVRNLAVFLNGLGATYAGGIVGQIEKEVVLTRCLNAMKGNINGEMVGGIIGRSYETCEVSFLVNAMEGSMTGNYAAGGVIGDLYHVSNSSTTATNMLNYMKGHVLGSGSAGGVVGTVRRNSYSTDDVSITKTLVAMQGSVQNAVQGSMSFVPPAMDVRVDASYGMTYNSNGYGTTSALTADDAILYHDSFTDLPYFKLEGTDPDGTLYDWDFLYANIGGKYADYTHLSVHTASHVSAPLPTEFSGVDGTQTYLTYANADALSVHIDSRLAVIETAATTVVQGTPKVSETVTWAKNGDGQYLVESEQHLLQIMLEGAYCADTGDAPTDYWGSSYLQTSDIDLANDQASIKPIGDSTTNFTGTYDGGEQLIQNWSYADGTNVGLFGSTSGATLKHIRLAGTWTIVSSTHSGFLAGVCVSSTVYDIEGDFSDGTSIGSSTSLCGALFGSLASGTSVFGATVKGSVSFDSSTVGSKGGVVGYIFKSTMGMCRNFATFPNGISGFYVGGILGQQGSWLNCTVTKCLNAMTGDLTSSKDVGGIIGRCQANSQLDFLVNSMTGNITGDHAGGVIGLAYNLDQLVVSASHMLNYMTGNIVHTSYGGGLLGRLYKHGGTNNASSSITKSVVAMRGSVNQSVNGNVSPDISPLEIEVTVDTGFGLTYDANDDGSATMVVDDAFVYHPSFTDLPYFKLDGTDPDGAEYDWDFLFANIGGKNAAYTHLSVHTASVVSAPFPTEFSGVDGTQTYLTYANADALSVHIDSRLAVIETAATTVVQGTPKVSETVTWAKNGDGQYLVESEQHLLQIMLKGAYCTDAGDAPTDYWSSSYVQTSDIDLANDQASIVPIGADDTTPFTGTYDGGFFKISNCSMTSATSSFIGLFGYVEYAALKRIRLSGVWTMQQCTFCTGFLVGRCRATSIHDVEGDFSEGTSIGDRTYLNSLGVLIGQLNGMSSLFGATVSGIIDFGTSWKGLNGGIVGASSGASLTMVRNTATFPNGIGGSYTGGIVGYMSSSEMSFALNAMKGDVTGQFIGGVVGFSIYVCQLDSIVNAMTGNITGTLCGGIIGQFKLYSGNVITASKMLNYMHGNIESSTNAGGIVSTVYIDSGISGNISIEKSVVAMRGSVTQSVLSSAENIVPSVVEVSVITSFGMAYTGNNYSASTMVVDDALVYHPSFTDLPYIKMEGTDPDGTVYDWDFLYANIGGKYADYTHLSVHNASHVSAPLPTEFSGVDSSQTYLTYANADDLSLYMDSSLTIVETTAEIAFDHDKSQVLFGTPDPPETLLWTTDEDGAFEVASKEHLLQLMNQGALYTDLGDAPTDYWSSSYVQTSDIDLANDHASITPIGTFDDNFTGNYDGGRFQIRNWSYLGTSAIKYIGLFGFCNPATLKHIRLSGVWTLSADGSRSGFLTGYLYRSTVYDVEGNFDVGTRISGSSYSAGGLFGDVSSFSVCTAITLRGTLEFEPDVTTHLGGIFGWLGYATLEQCRNLASFPDGIRGVDHTGGLLGRCTSPFVFSKCLNAMQGDLSGLHVGGISGSLKFGRYEYGTIVNGMTGNITSTGTAGGIFGYMDVHDNTSTHCTRLLNYMKGSVAGSTGSGGITASIEYVSQSGDVSQYGDISITKSIVAMQGEVGNSVRASENFTPSMVEVSIDTSFGMTYAGNNDYGSATMVVDDALVYNPLFTDLPYFKLEGTDPDGTLYDWDFVYANVGGKFPKYTHLSVHNALVSTPLPTEFSGVDSSQTYLTYANADDLSLSIDSSLTIVETTAEIAFDYSKSQILYGTPDPPDTLMWTTDEDGNFEVASKEHLLQLMNQGALYTDMGDHPTNCWGSSYVQTASIDLATVSQTSIVPIGGWPTAFSGTYDGGSFTISNCSVGSNPYYTGLFGRVEGGTLKRIRLAGIWTIQECTMNTGFLAGACSSPTTIYDVDGHFAEGTSVQSRTSSNRLGGLVGLVSGTSIYGATVRGIIDFGTGTTSLIGGIAGYGQQVSFTMVRNIAVFPNGISGTYAGGIIGGINWDGVLSHCLNAMKGNVTGLSVGGIIGQWNHNCQADVVVNAMEGSITGSSTAGGVIGHLNHFQNTSVTATRMLNYVKGDVLGPDGAGGVVGSLTRDSDSTDDVSITKTLVAMQGSVENAVLGTESFVPSLIDVSVNKSFGMTCDSNDDVSATTVVDDALVYHSLFPDLPYIKFEGTDPDGKVYDDWDFVFPQVGGKFPKFTHLSVHNASHVSAPLPTEFSGVDSSHTYLTYANADDLSLYIDSSLTIVETTAEIAFDYSKSQILYGTPDPPDTLMWTQNEDGAFEVASKEHLLQLMNMGTLYTDLGDHPLDYWSSSYVQTSEIDLAGDHGSIVPIGNDTTYFNGTYDGGSFAISNWSCSEGWGVGLFGYAHQATLKRIRLGGVWTIQECSHYAGFLVGFLKSSTMHDVEGHFAEGTFIGGEALSTRGTLIGYVYISSVYGATVTGIVDFGSSTTSCAGGVAGYVQNGSMTMARNLAVFPNGIGSQSFSGGICGWVGNPGVLSHCLNAMKGNITSVYYAGGIAGQVYGGCEVDSVVNSMEGSVTASAYAAGGFIGRSYHTANSSITCTHMLNYMRGDVLGPSGAGGVVGTINRGTSSTDVSITKTLVAMQGSVENAVRGFESFVPSLIDVSVDTSFGMFFDVNDYNSSTTLISAEAILYHDSFTDLPYFKLEGTDPDGKTYKWEFLFPNIGGKYDQYTHLTAHTAQVSYPLYADFGLDEELNDTVYLTFANEDEGSLYAHPSLTVVETAAVVVFDHAKTQVLHGTPTPASTVLWTKDEDGKFEVSSIEHILQLMNKGTLYTDLGVERPSLYWTHHYVQTAEIDLDGYQEHVVCIGDDDTRFVGSYEENGFEVVNWQHLDDDAHEEDHQNLFGDRHTLEWTKNAQGQFQVESDDHLVQIMNQGQRFVDEGDSPVDYWSASTSYIQTADIDLSASHAKILPIGTASSPFYGQFDGSAFKISNWTYTQPEDSANVTATGLFGNVTNAEIRRVRLEGVWVLNGSDNASEYIGEGFLCGSAIGSTIYDVEGNLATGSLMSGGPTSSAPITHRVGCLVGSVSDSVVSCVTLKGAVDLKNFGADGHNTHVGGVIGYVVNSGSSMSMIRNTAVFSSGINGNTAGGVIAYVNLGALSIIQNAMQGNVVGVTHAGGVCGMLVGGGNCEVLVSAMTGSVESTQNSGGIIGCVDVSSTSDIPLSQAVNYMRGDVSSVASSGGIIGLITRSGTGDLSVSNSIVAMHGSVNDAVCGSQTFTPSDLSVVVKSEFGMNFSSSSSSSSSSSDELYESFTTSVRFPDLPYIPLVGTDPDGTLQKFDFVFANLGGKSVYEGLFTHLSLHQSRGVSAPYATEYSGSDDSSDVVVYLTYANIDKGHIYVDDSLSILETDATVAFNHGKTAVLLGTASLPLICEPRALVIKASVDLSVTPVYRLTYQETSTSSEETLAHADVSNSVIRIRKLDPETTYAIRLYSSSGDTVVEHVLVTTKANSAQNYDVADFYDTKEERYDLSEIGDQVPSAIINEIFTTGDVVEVDMGFARKTAMETTFVKKGEVVEADQLEALLLPFEPSTTETQESTIKLSDNTTVQVRLEQGSGEISVGGTTYTSGKSFIMDGKKCTVWDI